MYKQCDCYWLLLIVDYMDPAQDQEINWPQREPPIESAYEKVVVFRPQLATYIEVPIEIQPRRVGRL